MLGIVPVISLGVLPQIIPIGFALDCRSWPGGTRVHLIVRLETYDGSRFETGRIEISPTADAEAVQLGLASAIGDWGTATTQGKAGASVVVFGPKGRSLKSIRFESDGWEPVIGRIIGKPK